MKAEIKSTILGIAASAGIFLILGIPTALIPNSIYVRMVPALMLDYAFLTATSVMLGAYISLHFYSRVAGGVKEDLAAASGGAAGILAFGCPICNALLVSLLGTAAILTYYEPVRPAIGAAGIALLGAALYLKFLNIRCFSCEDERV